MRIQHNIMAMSAYRNYTNNVSAMKKNLEKLSSGYKINRAGDDAAGLAISEKMRAQITGLETAQKNAKDGISLVQTAEGALTEVHDMLNRMVELASMSANGTYDNTTDRRQLQKELEQLRSEIDRIADSSNFNGIKLLDGSLEKDKVFGVETDTFTADELLALLPDLAPADQNNEVGVKNNLTVVEADGSADGGAKFEISLNGLDTITTTGANDTFTLKIGNDTLTVTLSQGANDAAKIGNLLVTKYGTGTSGISINGATFEVENQNGLLKFSSKSAVDLKGGAKVEWSWKPENGIVSYADDGIASMDDGIASMDEGFVVYAAGDPTISPVGTGATVSVGSGSATVNTKDNIGWAGDAAAALASAAGVTSGDIKLSFESGSWKVMVGTTAALTAVAASATIPSSAASGESLEIDFGDGVKLTLTAAGVSAGETLNASDYQSAFSTAQTIGTLGVEQPTPTPSGGGTSGTQSQPITLPQVSGLTTDFSAATAATVISTSADATALTNYFKTGAGSSITVDGKTVALTNVALTSGSTFEDLAKMIGAAVKAEFAKDTQNDYSNIKVQIGNDTPIAIQAGGDMPQITITYTKTAKQTGGNTTGAAYHGVINSGMQNTNNGDSVRDKALANTRFDAGSITDLWADGSKIKIGNKEITIAKGENSTYAGGADVVDITKMTSAEEMVQALANAANNGNTVFSVGHDGTKITLQQLNTSDNMETREGIASYLGITTQKYTGANTAPEISKGLKLQIGDTADDFNQLTVDIKDMHADAMKYTAASGATGYALAADGMTIDDISIETQDDAAKAIEVIKSAINYVSDVRGTLGATQNRLDHTINNLSVMTENIQDAESTIRDVDVAEEMMAYTKNNILIQSAQAMLAQANQVPQGVLQLLG